MEHPGKFDERPTGSIAMSNRDYEERAFTVGLGGPVGSGKNEKVYNINDPPIQIFFSMYIYVNICICLINT